LHTSIATGAAGARSTDRPRFAVHGRRS
jgi:hypothetical protein